MSLPKIHSLGTVSSTMDVARELALSGEEPDTVVTAEFQTAGRGRHQRGWFAPRGANVCMTVIGRPVASDKAWQIALVAGVAAAEAVGSSIGLLVNVRFPNDIYLNRKKLGGILVETIPASQTGFVTPLVGIGINVNIPGGSFPEDLRHRATSVLVETGAELSVGGLTGMVSLHLRELWADFQRGSLKESILPRWRQLCLRDSLRSFELHGVIVPCRVVDLSDDGHVSLETAGGERHVIPAAQVILGDD